MIKDNSILHLNTESNTQAFQPQEWLPNNNDLSRQEIACHCISHIIETNSLWEWLNILEVWPIPIARVLNQKAPITRFKDKLPWNNYLWVWVHHDNDKEWIKEIMWEVDFIPWLIDLRYPDSWIDQITEHFNWDADIVYWQHVYENSSATHSTFPRWRRFMLDWTVKLLKDWWFLVIDNAWWRKQNILHWDWVYSKHLRLVWEYYYWDNEWIYVFQKPIWTDAKAEQEQTIKEKQHLLFDLENRRRKVEKLIKKLTTEEEWKIKTLKQKKDKIKQLKQQANQIPDIPNRDKVVGSMEKSIEWLQKDVQELEKVLLNIPNSKKEAELQLSEVSSYITETQGNIESLLSKN